MNFFKLLIKNALIVNGKNEPPFRGSVLVKDGRIDRIIPGYASDEDIRSLNINPDDTRIEDAEGAYLTPGFIDIHRHGDWKALMGADGGDDELLNRQGLTTVVNGNCGLSVMPCGTKYADQIRRFLSPVTGSKPAINAAKDADRDLASYFEALKSVPRTVNSGMLAGNGTIRASAAGYHPGALTGEEIRLIRREIEKALEDGALGVSLGLGYAPEFEYDAAGLIEVLEPLRGTSVPLTTHIRSEGDGSYESIEEVIRVSESLGVPLHISHMKCIGRRNWHTGPERTLDLLHRKNSEGMTIDYDLYPYKTGSTQLLHVIPPSFQTGGADAFMAGLRVRSFRDALTDALKTPAHDFENIVELVGFENIYASTLRSEAFRAFSGQSIAAIADALEADPYETLYDVLAAENCDVTMLDTIASDDDMTVFYRDPLSSVISDAIYPDGGRLHPRVYASFPLFLIRWVRETGLLAIEEAIHKMTAKPASVLKIDRGVIEEGAAADLCLFRLEDLTAPATFEEPEQLCEGFRLVTVGGRIVVDNDVWQPESAGCGRIIRR